jgi:GxxExxY protein
VHRQLGPGLLESVYEACLCAELNLRGIPFVRQASLPVLYKGTRIECGYRVDLIVEDQILVELKTVDRILPIHEAQVITYLRIARLPVGLLANFNVLTMKGGLRRLTANRPHPSRSPDLPVQITERTARQEGEEREGPDFADTP